MTYRQYIRLTAKSTGTKGHLLYYVYLYKPAIRYHFICDVTISDPPPLGCRFNPIYRRWA